MMHDDVASVPFGFFSRRWRRQVPLGTLFWRDMVVVGSGINLVAAFVALMALGQDPRHWLTRGNRALAAGRSGPAAAR